MIRWINKHPLLAHLAATVPQLAILLAVLHTLYFLFRSGYTDEVERLFRTYVLAVPGALVAITGLLLTLKWRRSGQGVWPLPLFVPLSTVQVLVCWVGVYTYAPVMIFGELSPPQRWLGGFGRWDGVWLEGDTLASMGCAAGASLAAVLLGLAIARHKSRTGRWETIGRVERPET